MTDLEKFVALYLEFGIECKVNPRDGGGWRIVFHESSVYGPEDTDTTSDKFDGYNGFHSRIEFDADGKFVKQGFWE